MAEESTEKQEAPEGRGPRVLIMGLSLVTLLSVGAAVYAFMRTPEPPAPMQDESATAAQGPAEPASAAKAAQGKDVVAIRPFVVNLSDPGITRFLRLHVSLLLDGPALGDEITAREPEIRDNLLMYLTGLSSSELKGVEGMEEIRVNVQRRLNNMLKKGQVERVYITEFMVQ